MTIQSFNIIFGPTFGANLETFLESFRKVPKLIFRHKQAKKEYNWQKSGKIIIFLIILKLEGFKVTKPLS